MGKMKREWEKGIQFSYKVDTLLEGFRESLDGSLRRAYQNSIIFGVSTMKIPDIAKAKESFKSPMQIVMEQDDEWEQLELDLSEWANNSPVFPPQIDLKLPELPKEENGEDCKKDIYCDCLFPKVRKVSMIFSSYDFCDSCKKEKK